VLHPEAHIKIALSGAKVLLFFNIEQDFEKNI
jgi:hypothetical protein